MARGLKRVRHRRDDPLARIGWDRLEHLLAEHYRREGHEVDHVGTGGTGRQFDGGIDLKLRKDDAYILVQSKHWNAYQVTHNAVHELLGLMVNEGATGAILVTSGEFTRAAIEAAARQGHVQLVDGNDLRQMLGPLPEPLSPALQPSEWLVPLASRPSRLSSNNPRDALVRQNRAWLVVAAVCFIGFVLLVRGLLLRTQGTAGPSSTIAAQPALPVPTGESPGLMETAAHHEPDCGLHGVQSALPSCDGRLGDARLYQPPPQTAAEIRESQRKADEAMKIIEATTPEM